MKSLGTRILCCFMVLIIVLGSMGIQAVDTDEAGGLDAHLNYLAAFGARYHFTNFLYDHINVPQPDAEYIIDAADFTFIDGMDVRLYEDFEGVPGTAVWTDESGLIEWEIYVRQSGLYNISVLYYSVEGRSSDIQRAVFINGELPFFEANPVEFRRTWVNQRDYIQRDAQGNDMRPTQVEQHRWYESIMRDAIGTYIK